ncbi:hypothetical protein M1L60_17430 [Actinoplanes sp. TRM 88003]|uniref:Disulfide bond formation protein B n=1 Tax=Paractinoplanes aksuensis TaxID=2939490 RepID=A0ABT1DNH6_9ACTN|nr:hypothetical protein [Actinoplanes aksuensis]MCO8272379.1 hypothetical protein [Actinoplanes aksuensis]
MLDEEQRDKTVELAPWWVVTGRALRFVLGALSLVGGLTWALLNLHVATAALDAAVGAVLAAGGLVLLMPHRIRLPRLVTALVMSGFAVAGTVAGLVYEQSRECCEFAYVAERGWPFHWVGRGGVADDPETAIRLAQSSAWSADVVSLTANLLVWSYVGLILVVIAVLVRRARPVRAEEPESPVM